MNSNYTLGEYQQRNIYLNSENISLIFKPFNCPEKLNNEDYECTFYTTIEIKNSETKIKAANRF